ncbi:DUF6600 domain-containing protein [Dyella sp. 2HG41-7]|uniref:DUF6600 domain-containing protein n=1 Tax=Dyella sp. 2HG41-7 TaxID=2883239 RepID=UPI001F2712BF|nr:DUF6600 domain-containing protein [Dyella sp. 2HG41-7]
MRALMAVVSFSRGWRMLLATLLLICASLAWAQSDDSQPGDAGDPPARVARLSYATGDLGLMPSGSTDWSAADVNRPLTNGDKLSSGADARAELDLGGASLRINSQSDVGVLNLNDQIGQFELTQGTVNLTVRNIDQGATYEIDTPTLALVVNQPGTFRIDVGANGNGTTITVIDGGGIVYGENNAQRDVFSGRTYEVADSTLNNITVSDIQGRDEFDAWCNDRDAQYANTDNTQQQYVSSDVVGAQDLNQYGDWQQDEDYGNVWYPTTVVAGWAPYQNGHWVWIGPWGWTWVDAMPWGFAPYHYGRWAYIRNRWGWIPCPPRARPIYAPALVAFVGMGAGGPVGWFPLGPHEVYNPWYRASRGYYTNVNVTNIAISRNYNQTTVINNIHNQYNYYRDGRPVTGVDYVNRNAPHAFTAVPAQAFASARNVRSSQMHVDPQQWAHASVVAPTALQRPSSASFGQPRNANMRPLPAAGFNRPVVAVNAPSPSVAANASFRAGQPASNVRMLGVQPRNVPNVVSGRSYPRYATPGEQPQNVPAPRQAPQPLPQVPHFAPAQQIQQVQQAPHYAPAQPSFEQQQREREATMEQQQQQQRQRDAAIEQQRMEAVQRERQYTPEQPRQYVPQQQPRQYEPQPNPSYRPQPYQYQAPPQYARPEMSHPAQQPHPQNAPQPHYAPPAKNDNQQH